MDFLQSSYAISDSDDDSEIQNLVSRKHELWNKFSNDKDYVEHIPSATSKSPIFLISQIQNNVSDDDSGVIIDCDTRSCSTSSRYKKYKCQHAATISKHIDCDTVQSSKSGRYSPDFASQNSRKFDVKRKRKRKSKSKKSGRDNKCPMMNSNSQACRKPVSYDLVFGDDSDSMSKTKSTFLDKTLLAPLDCDEIRTVTYSKSTTGSKKYRLNLEGFKEKTLGFNSGPEDTDDSSEDEITPSHSTLSEVKSNAESEPDSTEPSICFGIIDEDESPSLAEDESDLTTVEEEELREQPVLDIYNEPDKDFLPPGWTLEYHQTGLPIYYHAGSNVCILSKPYALKQSEFLKSHMIRKSAIPCMKNVMGENVEVDFSSSNPIKNIETVAMELDSEDKSVSTENSSSKTESHDPEMRQLQYAKRLEKAVELNQPIRDYYKRLFPFRTTKRIKFNSWDVRRTYMKTLKRERNKRMHSSNPNSVSLPVYRWDSEKKDLIVKEGWVIDPTKRSIVAILHEYLQQTVKMAPVYKFLELENSNTPYSATVIIDGTEYGVGIGRNKKEAKILAAKNSMEILLPHFKDLVDSIYESSMHPVKLDSKVPPPHGINNTDFTIFDNLSIMDPNVPFISKFTCNFMPYEILELYVKSKSSENVMAITYKMNNDDTCTMKFSDESVTVSCTNKRDGKQKAAQALLQKLHPYLCNWGSLLRLYGTPSLVTNKKSNQVVSQDEDLLEYTPRGPNLELLAKLRESMLRLQEKIDLKKKSEFPGPSNIVQHNV